MKTILKLFGLFIAIFITAYLCNKSDSVDNELFLSNVEAFAGGEKTDINSFATGSLDCPKSNQKVYRNW